MDNRCISCGMPMVKDSDFPLGDRTKEYCVHCSREDGSMKSYDEALSGMTAFIVNSQGLDRSAAEVSAKTMLAQMPAWRGRG